MRWRMGATSTAESGSDAGSNFFLESHHDNGTTITNVLTINRNNAFATWAGSVMMWGGFGANGATPSGKITISGSRGSATATVLESLLQALQTFGLITDSTTA